MKLKICGMKYEDNLREVAALAPDYLGFIFYEKSKRFMVPTLTPEVVKSIPSSIKKVGVFVNHTEEQILKYAKDYDLQVLQLHGEESVELCSSLKAKGYTIIKVFSVGETFDFNTTVPFEKVADYFLFDTKTESYGGSGKKFDWKLLEKDHNRIPLFLSGGIGLEELDEVFRLRNLNLFALDVNSRFEVEPGRKDITKLQQLMKRIKGNEH